MKAFQHSCPKCLLLHFNNVFRWDTFFFPGDMIYVFDFESLTCSTFCLSSTNYLPTTYHCNRRVFARHTHNTIFSSSSARKSNKRAVTRKNTKNEYPKLTLASRTKCRTWVFYTGHRWPRKYLRLPKLYYVYSQRSVRCHSLTSD